MAAFDPELAMVRFGTGLGPGRTPPASAGAMLAALAAPDHLAARYPVTRIADQSDAVAAYRRARAQRQRNAITAAEARAAAEAFLEQGRASARSDMCAQLARAVADAHGFRDRLTWFWADHFAVRPTPPILRFRADTFVEDAIRPHLTGPFADMLIAATLHPVMLSYLDQPGSVGPGSAFAAKAGGKGLNENLAREVLELHTLGVGAGYDQADVRQMAELLTGVTIRGSDLSMQFLPGRAEPGAEQVLDFLSSDGPARLEDIKDALRHLATRPETAEHMARKLAVHFVADDPDPALVATLAARWRETGGHLAAVYRALLDHPAAMARPLRKVKRPVEMMASGLRALGAGADDLVAWQEARPGPFRFRFGAMMRRMGQDWARPDGPDGWPEAAEAWITPATLSARLQWTGIVQTLPFMPRTEPPQVLADALGSLAGQRLRRAIGGAETRPQAVSLILMSPEFQRR